MSEFKELPEGWRWVKLGEICKFYQGYGFPKSLQGVKIGKIPFYKVGDISRNVKNGSRYLKTCDNYIDETIVSKLKVVLFPINTIVFAKIGEALKLNRRAIIKISGIVDNNALGLKAQEAKCIDLYLYHFLNTVKLEGYSQATTVPSVRKSDIYNIEFPLPPINTQKIIVNKIEELLSDLNKGIENLKLAQQQLKTYRQTILKCAFDGKLTHNSSISCNSTSSWKEVVLSEVADTCLGKMLDKRKNKGNFEYYLRNVSVRWGTFDLDDLGKMRFEKSESERYGIKYGDIIVCEGGEPGRCAIWKEQLPNMKIQKALHRIRVKETLSEKYLYYYLFFIGETGKLEKFFTGTTIKHLTGRNLKTIPIPLPSIKEQLEIVAILELKLSLSEKEFDIIGKTLSDAEILKNSILKKALEGKLI
jgi:type I restriction enzyme, S subunit